MKSGARIQAAIEVLQDVVERHRPASAALADWGKAHRFAGSGDRAAIGNLVFDCLRRKSVAADRMQSATPRALVLGTLAATHASDAIAALCDGSQHAPATLSAEEFRVLELPPNLQASPWVRGNYPEWLHPALTRVFADRVIDEADRLAERAPVDLRVNTLKASRDSVRSALAAFQPLTTPWSPSGLRLKPPEGSGRQPNVEAEASHGRGWFEVQDEGSQIAAALCGAVAGNTVLDLCAGAGGKTLALAAAMSDTGRIYAYDSDKMRLRPIFERLQRAGVSCVEVMNGGDSPRLDDLGARFDLVLVDAPCSGSGTWRRKPDSKWRLKPEGLVVRQAEQRHVLDRASQHVRPGGRLVYVTCSLLPEENTDQIAAFRRRHPEFAPVPWRDAWSSTLATTPPPASADASEETLLLTPRCHGTDGFFIAVLQKRS
jgi:16S rRNA (cytosine967-C5)-methyltransferase